MTTKAIGFGRFSPRPDAATSDSNDKQRERVTEYCKAKGYELIAWYEDSDVTGGTDGRELDPFKALDDRTGFWDALEALKRGYVLVVRWRHRIARDVYIQEWFARMVANKGARIEAADEGNGDTPQDKLVRAILSAMAEYERTMTRLATARAMRRHQAAGRRMGRADRCPYGKRPGPMILVNGENRPSLEDDPDEQETLRTIGEFAISHPEASAYDGCRYLDGLGIPRRGGKTWGNAHRLVGKLMEAARTSLATSSWP